MKATAKFAKRKKAEKGEIAPKDVASPKTKRGLRVNLSALLPLIALVVGLALTTVLALNERSRIEAEQARVEEAARQEFGASLENSAQNVGAEVDRIRELMAGISAFASVQTELTQDTIDDYLDRTSATARFDGLDQVLVNAGDWVDNAEPKAEAEGGLDLDLGEAGQGDVVTPEQQNLRDSIETRLTNPPTNKTTFLSEHTLGATPVTAVHFQARTAEQSGWVTLVFESDRFLSRVLRPVPNVTKSLVNVNEPIVGPVVDLSVEEASLIVSMDGDKQLIGEKAVDVFGNKYVVRSEANDGFVEDVDTNGDWVIWFTGALASLAVFAVARLLAKSRAQALERAQTSELERKAIDRRFRASFQNAPIGMAELEGTGRVVSANEAFAHQTGSTPDALIGRGLSELVHPSDREDHEAMLTAVLNGQHDNAQSEHRYRDGQGRDVWVNESISVIENTGDSRSLLLQTQDVTARRRAAWELARQALHDDLTGLPNRALFLNRLNNAIDRADRHPGYIAVMFIDVDRFKVINDSLGHETGDQFLIEIAERVGTAVRTGDTVARFGGDEFVVLCENVDGESEANLVAQRIQQAFVEPFILTGQQTFATVSLGITLSRGEEESADALLRDADAAMYRAKDGGRNRSEIFNHAMRSKLVARMEIESQLRDALENGEMVLHFQAIVDPQTFLPAGYEALIRWNHPEKGLLGPGAFLPVAEDAGLIHLVDSFVLRTTCHQIAEWTAKYPAARNIYVSTNWSARHLGAFVQQVEQVLAETGINPAQLVIEVTEGFLLEDSDGSLKTLKRLKELGVNIAIDDFGTGYSSLSYLTRLEVDYLKIDQSFVAKLPDDQASAAVIGAIADMAARLDIKLIAEGVETDEQMAMLAQLGSPRLQGYRFAKPRPASHIDQHLAERSQPTTTAGQEMDPESPRVLIAQQ